MKIVVFSILTSILTVFYPVINIKNKTYQHQTSNLLTKYSHPLYMSICEITHNSKDKNVEIAIKVFADDLEKAVSKANNNVVLNLNTKQEAKNADALIALYLQKSLTIKLNNKAFALKWLGKEVDKGDATWCYFEIPTNIKVKKIGIHNTIFTEIYPKQNNIVQLKTSKGNKSLLLNKDLTDGELVF